MGVSPQTLSMWKQRGAIPYERTRALAAARGISLDYLLLGAGSPYVAGSQLDMPLLQQIATELEAKHKELAARPQDCVYFVGLIYEKMMRLPPEERQACVSQEVEYLMQAFLRGTLMSVPPLSVDGR
jgi:hypothetical protein